MFQKQEQLSLFDVYDKQQEIKKLGRVNQTTHNGDYIEFVCVRTKKPTTIKASNIKRFIWSSSNERAYIQKKDGVLSIGLTLWTLHHIAKCYKRFDIEVIECFKYQEIMSICVFGNGETRDLKEKNE